MANSPNSKKLAQSHILHKTRGWAFGTLVLKGMLGPQLRGITNEMLASFNVLEHLNGLAICFGKVAVVESILNRQGPETK